MDDNSTKIIKEKFDSLPESIKEVIISSNYEETLLEIGNQYKLTVEQLGILERETTLVMMGLTPTKDFETELTRELKIDKQKGNQITKDINEKIFLKIRELLKLMNTPAGEEPSLGEEIKIQNSITPDKQILKDHGIEILNGNTSTPAKATPQEGNNTLPVPEKLELEGGKEEPHPILAQKLSGPVQTPVVKTEHILENITKTDKPNQSVEKVNKPAVDPYREIPE